jgi:structural maintenance of chromosome 2
LIVSKESQIKRQDEDYMNLEGYKIERSRDLATLIHKSIDKVEGIQKRQELEMSQFEEAEQSMIEDKRKRLHYESIRIEEIKKEVKTSKDKVTERLQIIEEKVYEDTKPL